MRVFAFIGLVMKVALARMAMLPRLVWEGGKLVAQTFFPGAPAEAAAAEAELAAALSQQAGSPAAAAAAEPVDPATEWGQVARSYAFSRCGGFDEVDISPLDEAAQEWLTGLYAVDLLKLTKVTSKEVGLHLFGEKMMPGVPRCETLGEYQRRILEESTPGTLAHTRKTVETATLVDALESLRAEGRLPVYAPV